MGTIAAARSFPMNMGAFARLVAVLCVVVASGCATLPPLGDRTVSVTQRDTADTRLGKAIATLAARQAADRGGLADASPASAPAAAAKSGLHALPDAREALAVRLALADTAERTLDVQYYIWRSDVSGTLMFDAVRRAADRGVRVRLLLDDNNTVGLDEPLRALDAHPGIEVRLFNPFVLRNARMLGYLTDFRRLNRRMHNKSFTADNQATIIGGRNIGDEYFDMGNERAFADLDVLAVGAIVGEVSTDFDRYWSSESAYPVDRLLPPAGDEAVAIAAVGSVPEAGSYSEAMRRSRFRQDLLDGSLKLDWAVTRLVSDDPAKVLQKSAPAASLPERFESILGKPVRLLEMVSPYFVPRRDGVDYLVSLAKRGVEIRVLTNALAATDVVAAHAGYARWRKTLLRAGVRLYEFRPLPADPQRPGVAVRSRGSGGSGGSGGRGSSESSLHAKTFSVDSARVVIGSFNFDPRSVELNTELGFVIDSPALAKAVDDAYSGNVLQTAWQVTLSESGDLQWSGSEDGVSTRYDADPAASFWRRAGAAAVSLLPIDWML